jgi:uncharacterized protein YbjT (DUF2867 family)
MNILLTGASGFIGRHLAAALIGAGHRVKPVSRRDGIDVRHMLAPQDWLPHLDGIDAVINGIGVIGETRTQRFAALHTQAPSALFRACARAGIRRVVQISALGADETAFSAYHLSKRAADDCLRSLDLDGFVLRPSLVYGRGGASTALFMRLARLPRIPVVGTGLQAIQPVHVSDVAATVLRCLAAPAGGKTLDVVGPERIVLSDWLLRMRHAQGLPPAPLLHVPVAPALALARCGYRFSPLLNPENLRMLNAGNCADVEPLAQFLGRLPLAFLAHLLLTDTLVGEQKSSLKR